MRGDERGEGRLLAGAWVYRRGLMHPRAWTTGHELARKPRPTSRAPHSTSGPPFVTLCCAVSATVVKQLRDSTGAGMMDCKKALGECDGDFDKATEVRA